MSTITLGHSPIRTSTITSSTRPARRLHAVPARPVAPAAPHVRLTRRGKAAVLAAAVAVIALLAIMFGPSSTATGEAGTPQATTNVRVMPGHTLWQIASDANPNGDIRKTVDDIVELNALPNASALQMGSEIAVPVYK